MWADKYAPSQLDAVTVQRRIARQLQQLAGDGDFPHLLLHGPSGAGKRTVVHAFLAALFGAAAAAETTASETAGLVCQYGQHHLNVTCSTPTSGAGSGTSDVYRAIQDFAMSRKVIDDQRPRVIILQDADLLPRSVQTALRRTMEVFTRTCRFILLTPSPSRILSPLRSRCLLLRAPAPSFSEIRAILVAVANQEMADIPAAVIARAAEGCDRNLRRALLSLESWHVSNEAVGAAGPVGAGRTREIDVPLPDWQRFVQGMAAGLVTTDGACEDAQQRLQGQRGNLWRLLEYGIEPKDVVLQLLRELAARLDTTPAKMELVQWAAHYEHRCSGSRHPLVHIEAFLAEFLRLSSPAPGPGPAPGR